MRLLSFITAISFLVSLGLAQPIIKIDWTQVNTQLGSPESTSYSGAPRAAAFSDGRYIIVYTTIVPESTESWAVGQIFYANGSVAVNEFALDSSLPGRVLTSPNVVVFNDDTFLVAYSYDNSQPNPVILARRFNADGKPAGSPFEVQDTNSPITSGMKYGFKLVGFADKSYSIVYPSVSQGCLVGVTRDSADLVIGSPSCLTPLTTNAISASLVTDRAQTTAFGVSETGTTDLNIGQITPQDGIFAFFSYGTTTNDFPANPVIALSGDTTITIIYNLMSSLYYATLTTNLDTYSNQILFESTTELLYDSPAIIGLNGTSVLMAYKINNNTDGTSHLVYQAATHVRGIEDISLNPTAIQYSIPTDLHSFHMVPMLGGDLLVVAKKPTGGSTWRQVLTFCGNGNVELNEECDGSVNCDTNCRCLSGWTPFEGTCGLPNVVPVLDCVETVTNAYDSYRLHFSFSNQDGVEQTMEHGYQNYFNPSDFATDRPQTFSVGSTLTYPVSPYSVVIPKTLTEFNWVLGSYNLTVDLTNITAITCPSPGFVADVTTLGYIYDPSPLANNFGARYNVSSYRLTADIVQTGGSTPSKRQLFNNRYDITVFVGPANATSTTPEPRSADAVQAAIEDYKRNSTEVEQDLLQGFDPDTSIKEITPTPTGVEVRGNRYDSSNVTPPPSAAPTTTENNNPGSSPPPSNVNVPQAVSESSYITLSLTCVAAIFFCLVIVQ